jgi:hypothetical protein
VQAIKDMVAEVMVKPKAGEKAAFTLSDKCRVLDRFIKIESIRLDVQADDDSGSFFKQKEADDEQP